MNSIKKYSVSTFVVILPFLIVSTTSMWGMEETLKKVVEGPAVETLVKAGAGAVVGFLGGYLTGKRPNTGHVEVLQRQLAEEKKKRNKYHNLNLANLTFKKNVFKALKLDFDNDSENISDSKKLIRAVEIGNDILDHMKKKHGKEFVELNNFEAKNLIPLFQKQIKSEAIEPILQEIEKNKRKNVENLKDLDPLSYEDGLKNIKKFIENNKKVASELRDMKEILTQSLGISITSPNQLKEELEKIAEELE